MEDAVESRHGTEVLDLELRKSEERYRTLFNLVPVAVYCCDAAGVTQNSNRRAVDSGAASRQEWNDDIRYSCLPIPGRNVNRSTSESEFAA